MSKTTGGMAFPRGVSSMPDGRGGTTTAKPADGMTLRDYFAAKAMEGAFASGVHINIGVSYQKDMDNMALSFYSMADAMIKARSAE